jgi:hypothetical protein
MDLARGLVVFDRLPRRLKEALWESPLNLGLEVGVHPAEVPEVIASLHGLERVSTRKIWGWGHPQASGPRFKPLRRVSRESRLRTLATLERRTPS